MMAEIPASRPHRLAPPASLPVAAALLLTLTAAVGCATAPPPPTPPPPPPSSAPPPAETASAPPPPDARMVCGPGSRTVEWQEVGIPPEAQPIDLALGTDAVWVLFDPSFVLRVPRHGAVEPTFVAPNQEGERWLGIDVDPQDGSVWLARRDAYELLQLVGSSVRRVPLARVVGEGGLVEVVARERALHVTPFCADHALWSFDRQGEMLGSAFELPQGLGLEVDAGRPITLGHACTRLHLARDSDGTLLAFHPVDVRLHEATDEGWREVAGPFEIRPPDRYDTGLRVAGLPADSTLSYQPDQVRGVAVLAGRPTLLGSAVLDGEGDPLGTLLYRIEDSLLHPVVEHCGGSLLLDLETDAAGHAALTREGLIVSEEAQRLRDEN